MALGPPTRRIHTVGEEGSRLSLIFIGLRTLRGLFRVSQRHVLDKCRQTKERVGEAERF